MKRLLFKLLFFAFFTAFFLFVFYVMFYPQVGRYRTISLITDEPPFKDMFYMDTATGKIYETKTGKLYSYPNKN